MTEQKLTTDRKPDATPDAPRGPQTVTPFVCADCKKLKRNWYGPCPHAPLTDEREAEIRRWPRYSDSDAARAIGDLLAELDRLRQQVAQLRSVCAEAYQLAGAYDAPVEALDNLLCAAKGKPLLHETFLPAQNQWEQKVAQLEAEEQKLRACLRQTYEAECDERSRRVVAQEGLLKRDERIKQLEAERDAIEERTHKNWMKPLPCGHAQCFQRFQHYKGEAECRSICAICQIAALEAQLAEAQARIKELEK